MSLAACTVGPDAGVDLLAGYGDYVAELGCAQQAKSLRRLGALRFLTSFDDLDAWMARPTRARLDDTKRADAWPFVSWCFATGRLHADVDLIAARSSGCHYSTWARLHPDDVERTVAVGAQIGWSDSWVDQVCVTGLAFVCLTNSCGLDDLTADAFELTATALSASVSVTANHRRVLHGRLRALQQVCFQLGLLDAPPQHPNARQRSLPDQLAKIPQTEIRQLVQRYLQTCSTTLRPSTIEDRCDTFELFGVWLHDNHPGIDGLDQLDRTIMEQFLTWNHGRPSRGRRAKGEPVSIARQHGTVSALKTFFEDITLWGWAERPPRPLLHRSDLPRLPTAVPRALSPDADRDLMAAVSELDDVAARCALTILRGTGIRTGELLDLELDCLADYHGHGTWLRVPVGKLNTERSVPVDDPTLAAFDEWVRHRGRSRALEHPRTHRPVDFLWVVNGRRMGSGRLRRNLDVAAANAGIGHVHPHQLRHTYATTLVNGGMSIEALMAVLGHVTPEMTLRYAHLASDSIRDAYDAAITRARPATRFVAGPTGQFVPDHINWLHSEMIKTRVAHGYCSRHLTAGACTYANICEQCDNYVPDPAGETYSAPNSPTSSNSATTPNNAAGPTNTPDTNTSPTPSPATCAPSTTDRRQTPPLDPHPEGRIIRLGFTNYRIRSLLSAGRPNRALLTSIAPRRNPKGRDAMAVDVEDVDVALAAALTPHQPVQLSLELAGWRERGRTPSSD